MKRESVKINDGHLLCPICHNEYLHHSWVKIFQRPSEDDISSMIRISGLSNEFEDTFITEERKDYAEQNPSSRRDGIRIGFSCETCDSHIELCILQHKGHTIFAIEGYPNGRISEIRKNL